jgi:hypothetical protein
MTLLNHRNFTAAIITAASFFAVSACCFPERGNGILDGPGPADYEQIGPTNVYDNKTLFDFMDGEAEVYFPFGFRLLYTRVLRSEKTDSRMSVEIYDMGTHKGSGDVYRHYSTEGGAIIEGIGVSAWTDEWLLLFTRGSYFVRISPDPSPESKVKPTQMEMISLAREIDGLLR